MIFQGINTAERLTVPFRPTDIILLKKAEREIMNYCTIKKWIILLLLVASSDYAMSKRPQEKVSPEEDKPLVVFRNEKKTFEGQLTYLDTLNRGKEISLSDNDLNPILPESAAVMDQKDSKEMESEGFRVQCFASSQIERIRSEQKQLEFKVKYPVYIVFNAPYYKLLVGDFAKRSEADFALAKLKAIGYPDAWVARCKINPTKQDLYIILETNKT